MVLPAAEGDPCPRPDRRFLEAVERWMERCRPICIQVKVVPPRYVPVTVSVQLLVAPGAEKSAVRQALEDWLSPRAARIGRTVRRNDWSALLQKLPFVLQIRRMELRGTDQNSRQTISGDLSIPPDGLPALEGIDIAFIQI